MAPKQPDTLDTVSPAPLTCSCWVVSSRVVGTWPVMSKEHSPLAFATLAVMLPTVMGVSPAVVSPVTLRSHEEVCVRLSGTKNEQLLNVVAAMAPK